MRTGDVIHGLEAAAALPGKVFHAATRVEPAGVATSGGRVLCAVGLGATVGAAQRQAYTLAQAIDWSGHAVSAGHRLPGHRPGALEARADEDFRTAQPDADQSRVALGHRIECEFHHRVTGADAEVRHDAVLRIGVEVARACRRSR